MIILVDVEAENRESSHFCLLGTHFSAGRVQVTWPPLSSPIRTVDANSLLDTEDMAEEQKFRINTVGIGSSKTNARVPQASNSNNENSAQPSILKAAQHRH